MELRIDPLTGVQVQVTGSRQKRPNRPTSGCPFCVGGVEAPDPYEVKAFTNRWPSFPDDRCEVVLFAPDHDSELRTLPPEHVRKVVDLWVERSAALGARDDLAYVLVFENNGADVGATIPHPHGQIYSYPDVPALPATELARLAQGHRLLAYVSLVAFTMRGLRPRLGGAALLKPIATHEFLNVRTYVKHRGERGIYFLADGVSVVSRRSLPRM